MRQRPGCRARHAPSGPPSSPCPQRLPDTAHFKGMPRAMRSRLGAASARAAARVAAAAAAPARPRSRSPPDAVGDRPVAVRRTGDRVAVGPWPGVVFEPPPAGAAAAAALRAAGAADADAAAAVAARADAAKREAKHVAPPRPPAPRPDRGARGVRAARALHQPGERGGSER